MAAKKASKSKKAPAAPKAPAAETFTETSPADPMAAFRDRTDGFNCSSCYGEGLAVKLDAEGKETFNELKTCPSCAGTGKVA